MKDFAITNVQLRIIRMLIITLAVSVLHLAKPALISQFVSLV